MNGRQDRDAQRRLERVIEGQGRGLNGLAVDRLVFDEYAMPPVGLLQQPMRRTARFEPTDADAVAMGLAYIRQRYGDPAAAWTVWPMNGSYAVALDPPLKWWESAIEHVRFVLIFVRRHGGECWRHWRGR